MGLVGLPGALIGGGGEEAGHSVFGEDFIFIAEEGGDSVFASGVDEGRG